jgi:pilus assembly protein Flp/PilA
MKREGGGQMKGLMRFLKDEEGVTAMEYGLIAALIACVIIAAVTLAGQRVEQVFDAVANAIGGALT